MDRADLARPVGEVAPPQNMKSLDLVAWAWPTEVMLVTCYTLTAPAFLTTDWYELFLRALPLLTALIVGQGAAAYFGKAQPPGGGSA